jgi:hypothetical protein
MKDRQNKLGLGHLKGQRNGANRSSYDEIIEKRANTLMLK